MLREDTFANFKLSLSQKNIMDACEKPMYFVVLEISGKKQ